MALLLAAILCKVQVAVGNFSHDGTNSAPTFVCHGYAIVLNLRDDQICTSRVSFPV